MKKANLITLALACLFGAGGLLTSGMLVRSNEPIGVMAYTEKTCTITATNSAISGWTDSYAYRNATKLPSPDDNLQISGDDAGKESAYIKLWGMASPYPEIVVKRFGDTGSSSSKIIIKEAHVYFKDYQSLFRARGNYQNDVNVSETASEWDANYYVDVTPKSGKTVTYFKIGNSTGAGVDEIVYIKRIVIKYVEFYTLNYNANGGTGTMDSANFAYNQQNFILTNNAFTYGDRTFLRWNTKADGSGTSYNNGATISSMPANDLTLYAIWSDPLPQAVYTTAPTAKTGLSYTGSPQELVNAGVTEQGTVVYRIGDSGEFSTTIPTATDIGTYTVQHKIQGDAGHSDSEIGSINVSIAKPTATFSTTPTAKTDLLANGQPQELVNAGASEQGTVVYRLGNDGDFAEAIPTATEAGTYTVQFKILGDADHDDSDIGSVNVTIAAAPVDPDTPDTPVTPDSPTSSGLPGWGVALIVAGSVVGLLGICFLVLFFLFNKWIKEGDKAVRVMRFALGSRDGKQRYLAFPCKFAYRNKEEVFNTKEDALK